MADRIEQEFTIEAQRALRELERLEQGFARFQKRLSSMSRSISNFNRRSLEGSDATQKLSTNLQIASKRFTLVERSARQTSRAATDLTLSWETMARVVATQFIVRGLSDIRNTIRESVDQAVELQKQLNLIATISPNRNLSDIGGAVREISDNLNIPLLQAAEGVYNALSNQVGSFGESLKFTTEAARFAKATNSTLADSVDLLSGAMNTFGFTAEETADLAGKFFVAIDRGRVTADEIANTFGRVGPAAEAIGISLDEVLAGLAQITVQGTNASESLTQFRGIINALTKPTTELSSALREMGFASSEAAVQALGLPGLLDALVKSTDGSAEALAKLFPRVRGIGGVFSLTGENLEGFNETLREVQEAGEEFANSKFMTATAGDAETVTKALNRLQNVFIGETGERIVQRGADLVRFAGGLEDVEDVARTLAPALETLTLSVGGLVAITAGAKFAAFLGLATPLGAAAAGTIALGAGVAGLASHLDQLRTEELEESIRAAGAAAEAELTELKRRNAELLKLEREKNQDILSETQRRVAEANRILATQIGAAEALNTRLVQDTKAGLSEIIAARTRLLDEVTRASETSSRRILESNDLIRSIEQRQGGRDFEAGLQGRSDAEQVFARIERAIDIARRGQEQFNAAIKSGSEEAIKAARAALERAQTEGEVARTVAEQAGDLSLIRRAEDNLALLSTRQIELEEKLIATREQQASTLQGQASSVRETNRLIEEQAALLRQDPRDEQALQRLVDLAGQNLDLPGISDEITRVLRDRPVQLQLDLEAIQDELRQREFEIQAEVRLLFPEAGADVRVPDDVARQVQQQLEESEARLRREGEVSQELAEQTARRERLLEVTRKLKQEEREQRELAESTIADVPGFEADRALARAETIASLRENIERLITGDTANVEAILLGLNSTIDAGGRQLQDTQRLFATASSDIAAELRDGIDPARTIADELTRGANAVSNSLRNADVSGNFAGHVGFFADGGFASRGVDTIPAMLSPGESVISARSTQKFFSQLQAMNAGIQPVFRSEGGTVTMGDIDIHISGTGQSPERIAEAVEQRLIRRKRLGISRFGR